MLAPRAAGALALAALAAARGPVQPLDLRLVAGTRCLDGTRAGYYYAASPSNSSSRWVVYFEGGGACYSRESCAARAATPLGSSAKWAPTFTQDDNLLSADAAVNPVFFDAHKIYIPYCTGDAHGGTRSAALNATWPFFFSGHLNVVAIVREIAAAHLGGAGVARVLVTGSSAGGLGTLLNADYIADALGAAAVVTAAPEAGWFFPPVSLFPVWAAGGSTPVWSTLAFIADELWATYTLPACAAAHNASFCASASNLMPYLRVPMFVAENLVDSNQVFSELLAPRASPRLPAFEAAFHAAMVSSLRAAAAARADWAVWAPACVAHTENLHFVDPAVGNGTTVGGVSFRDAIAAWATGAGSVPRVLIDECSDPLPCNPSCPKGRA